MCASAHVHGILDAEHTHCQSVLLVNLNLIKLPFSKSDEFNCVHIYCRFMFMHVRNSKWHNPTPYYNTSIHYILNQPTYTEKALFDELFMGKHFHFQFTFMCTFVSEDWFWQFWLQIFCTYLEGKKIQNYFYDSWSIICVFSPFRLFVNWNRDKPIFWKIRQIILIIFRILAKFIQLLQKFIAKSKILLKVWKKSLIFCKILIFEIFEYSP